MEGDPALKCEMPVDLLSVNILGVESRHREMAPSTSNAGASQWGASGAKSWPR
jgi:hypothetical protein